MVNPSQAGAESLGRTHAPNIVYEGTKQVREVRPIQALYTHRQLMAWYRSQLHRSELYSLPEVTMAAVSIHLNRIEVGIDCEASRDSVNQRLPSLLSGSGIPTKAIQITVHPREFFPENPNDFECASPEVVDPATGISSPGFGGLFIDFDTRTTNVYMLEPSQEKAEELALAIMGGDLLKEYPDVRAIQGQYTWEQIVEWWYRIVDDPTNIQGASFGPGGFHAEPSRNRLVVEVRRERNPDVETDVGDFLDRIGVPREAVVFLGYDEPLR